MSDWRTISGPTVSGHRQPEETPGTETLGSALRRLRMEPGQHLLRRWNWKAALLSAVFRGGIFLGVNLSAGWNAALTAMVAEFAYRIVTSGFYGAFTAVFRRVRPAWVASLVVVACLPLFQHSLELLVHWINGTVQLWASIGASMGFTLLSTVFNLHVMRHGVLVVGREGQSLWLDLRRMPRLVVDFVGWPITAFVRFIANCIGLLKTNATAPDLITDTVGNPSPVEKA